MEPVLDKVNSMAALDLLFFPLPTLRHFGSIIRAMTERSLIIFGEPIHKGKKAFPSGSLLRTTWSSLHRHRRHYACGRAGLE
jgi:hypothetical protein